MRKVICEIKLKEIGLVYSGGEFLILRLLEQCKQGTNCFWKGWHADQGSSTCVIHVISFLRWLRHFSKMQLIAFVLCFTRYSLQFGIISTTTMEYKLVLSFKDNTNVPTIIAGSSLLKCNNCKRAACVGRKRKPRHHVRDTTQVFDGNPERLC